MPAMTDTPPEIAAMVRRRLMARSGAERFIMGARMFDAARAMVLASLPADLSEAERKARLFQRFYGQPLPSDE
ncbi:MAG: hypothetical protein H0U97_15455 [Gammaproteobacteria bacterium]|nr:hypothetical protein [Gammaproteobacteria bacterium]